MLAKIYWIQVLVLYMEKDNPIDGESWVNTKIINHLKISTSLFLSNILGRDFIYNLVDLKI